MAGQQESGTAGPTVSDGQKSPPNKKKWKTSKTGPKSQSSKNAFKGAIAALNGKYE
jgi:hypothetical protein